MGGNLFKLGRVPRARYLELEAEVRAGLDRIVGRDAYRIPRFYGDKPDFGDMDVVVREGDEPWSVVRERIARELCVTRSRNVGPLFSTVFRDELQVDYFPRHPDLFLSTYHFLCFNDVGNLLGKMFRRLGLKYGEDGLLWVHRGVRENRKKELLLTRDPARIFGVLGLDPGPWERGFEDLEAMFRWVATSPYFSVEPYVDRSASTERLMKQRRTMREFVAFVEREGLTRTFAYEEDRTRYVPLVAKLFPEVGLEAAIDAERAAEARELAIDAKLNGRVVMEAIPGLSGKELGDFMRRFREHRPDLDELLLASSDAEVRELIRAFNADQR